MEDKEIFHKEIFHAKTLNTLECTRDGEKNMVCVVHAVDVSPEMIRAVKNVYSVSGDITILFPFKGTLWIKTYPHIGQSATITISARTKEPFGKDIHIESKVT